MNGKDASAPPGQQARPTQPVRIVPENIPMYYSNTVMVATTPVDICLYFGRYSQTKNENQESVPSELYERQIYMTMDQARRLAQMLNQTIQAVDAPKGQPEAKQADRPATTATKAEPVRTSPQRAAQVPRPKPATKPSVAPHPKPTKPS